MADGRGPGTPGRRRFDPAGPITGLFFLALAGLFLARGLSDGDVPAITTLAPIVLIGLGLVGTVRVLTRSRRRNLR
ncbi:hypothetical protein D0T12_06535 [Actinomadura spongiicola]|uniref:Uncharacterized protein n=1 Tax=Actinomadura spongiicola TaxID=2303421 RepID=A0A372GM55_9ACTN|nr:hypothetical protein [Actinomadura spongiicola]RFS86262.1 hypothetical protein D0T12_06535 [Actinomadura spongiicola]